MAYDSQEARVQLLDDVVRAADELSLAIAALGEAYEELDERAADALEESLFRPAQQAYATLRRTHGAFAGRYGLPEHSFTSRSGGMHSGDPRVYLERAVEATERADTTIGELQDSMLPVEVGDPELRAGLSETRELIAPIPTRGRRLLRVLGR